MTETDALQTGNGGTLDPPIAPGDLLIRSVKGVDANGALDARVPYAVSLVIGVSGPDPNSYLRLGAHGTFCELDDQGVIRRRDLDVAGIMIARGMIRVVRLDPAP